MTISYAQKSPLKADLISGNLLVQILLLFDSLAQVGTFRLSGVAVTSQILCISITLNKRTSILFLL
jgi:hypothetical protein